MAEVQDKCELELKGKWTLLTIEEALRLDPDRGFRCPECWGAVRPHKALHSKLRVTPAMAAGVTDRLWEVSDIVALWETIEPKAGPRGPYKKRISD